MGMKFMTKRHRGYCNSKLGPSLLNWFGGYEHVRLKNILRTKGDSASPELEPISQLFLLYF